MINIEKLKPKIIEALKPLKLSKIILFGSYAYGTPNKDSDVDLYIVTNDEYMPQSWKEKSEIELKVLKQMEDIIDEYPTDLITHTKVMHEKFKKMDSLFSRKILNDGLVLL